MITSMIRPFLSAQPRFGQQPPASRNEDDAVDRHVGKYFLGDDDLSPAWRDRLELLRQQSTDGKPIHASPSLPDPVEHADAYEPLKKPTAVEKLFRYFPLQDTSDSPPFDIQWNVEPVFKRPGFFTRLLEGTDANELDPHFPLREVDASVSLKPDEPGPLRAWRYIRKGRRNQLFLAWQNPDKSIQHLKYKARFGFTDLDYQLYYSAVIFRSLNLFLAKHAPKA